MSDQEEEEAGFDLGIRSDPPKSKRPAKVPAASDDESKELKVLKAIENHLLWIFWLVLLATSVFLFRSCMSFVDFMEKSGAIH